MKEKKAPLRLADLSIRHPVTVCMVFLCFLVLGAISIDRIPLVMLPDVDTPYVGIQLPYPGSTPQQVLESITVPLEESLSTIPGLERITSTSNRDSSYIFLEFGLDRDVDWLRWEVRERLDLTRPRLPDDLEHVDIQTWGYDDTPIAAGRISSSRDLVGEYDLLDSKVRKALERVEGVGNVRIEGLRRQHINVDLRLADLRRHRVELAQVTQLLRNMNWKASLGSVADAGRRYGVLGEGSASSLDEIRNFPIGGAGLRLGDIADVRMGAEELSYGRHLNGENAVTVEVRKTAAANTVDTVGRVMSKIEELNRDPSLSGVTLSLWDNQGHEITEALSNLLKSGTLGALLAVAVLFFFLRSLAVALAVGFAIPFSILVAVGLLYVLGETLNVLSMMGLMLSTGLLVDNAVVVLESIYRKLERGEKRVAAAAAGTNEVTTAVVAATLTSMIIFAPLLVFAQTTDLSLWLANAGVSLIITLACSLLVSLTLIPMLLARFFRVDPAKGSVLQAAPAEGTVHREHSGSQDSASGTSFLTGSYLKLMSWTLRHRGFTVLLILGIFVTTLYPFFRLTDNPPEKEGLSKLAIHYEFTENYSHESIESEFVTPVERFLLANRERFKIANIYSGFRWNSASTRIQFDADKITPSEVQEIREEIARGLPEIPGAQISLRRPRSQRNRNQIRARLYGEDSGRLEVLALEAKTRFSEAPEFEDIQTEQDRGTEEVQVAFDRALTKSYNLTPASISELLAVTLRGRRVTGFSQPAGEVPIWVRLQPEDRKNLSDIGSLAVAKRNGDEEISLSQIAAFSLSKRPMSIRRENRRTGTSIRMAYLGKRMAQGKKEVARIIDSLSYPRGYGWSFGDWDKRQEKEDWDFYFNLLLALFLVYLVMASLFESLVHPFAIMFSLPFGFVGVSWFLFVTNTPFDMMAKIGLIILVGIVVNNGIILIDKFNKLRQAGQRRSEAILEGCRERLRPILMTAITTVVGLLPLAVGSTSIFGMHYFPMARTVIGGLLVSTALTLVVLPTIYTLLDDLAGWARYVLYRADASHVVIKI